MTVYDKYLTKLEIGDNVWFTYDRKTYEGEILELQHLSKSTVQVNVQIIGTSDKQRQLSQNSLDFLTGHIVLPPHQLIKKMEN